jgi:ubiquinone/menaquinone biosynthesis C-methylase UbiE
MQPLCPRCKNSIPLLTCNETGNYNCECGKSIPYFDGIYKFVNNDDFYEGRFVTSKQYETIARKFVRLINLWLSVSGNEERMVRKSLCIMKELSPGRKEAILNVGSGGGHGFLNKIGVVSSVDLSITSLLRARNVSDYCYQADVLDLPFANESFDLIFSSHLLGHIPLAQKQMAINEIYRVTKKGGFSLHSVECEANNFVYCKAKEYPKLYKKYFQDMYGHYGLEFPSICKRRFREAGFVPILEISDYCKGVIRPADSYKIFFGAKEYYEKAFLFRVLAGFSKMASINKIFQLVTDIIIYPFTIINRFYGADSVDSVKLLYQKL